MDWVEASRKYLNNSLSFPWHWYGDVPRIGPTHTYILRLLIGQVSNKFSSFASGDPSLTELGNLVHKMRYEDIGSDDLIMAIYTYCDGLESQYKHNRASKPTEVLDFLKSNSAFLKDFHKRVKLSLGLDIYKD